MRPPQHMLERLTSFSLLCDWPVSYPVLPSLRHLICYFDRTLSGPSQISKLAHHFSPSLEISRITGARFSGYRNRTSSFTTYLDCEASVLTIGKTYRGYFKSSHSMIVITARRAPSFSCQAFVSIDTPRTLFVPCWTRDIAMATR